jgi:hypothetical protein
MAIVGAGVAIVGFNLSGYDIGQRKLEEFDLVEGNIDLCCSKLEVKIEEELGEQKEFHGKKHGKECAQEMQKNLCLRPPRARMDFGWLKGDAGSPIIFNRISHSVDHAACFKSPNKTACCESHCAAKIVPPGRVHTIAETQPCAYYKRNRVMLDHASEIPISPILQYSIETAKKLCHCVVDCSHVMKAQKRLDGRKWGETFVGMVLGATASDGGTAQDTVSLKLLSYSDWIDRIIEKDVGLEARNVPEVSPGLKGLLGDLDSVSDLSLLKCFPMTACVRACMKENNVPPCDPRICGCAGDILAKVSHYALCTLNSPLVSLVVIVQTKVWRI